MTQANSELAPPAGFAVLIEVLAQEMVAHGITPGTPSYESFVKIQVAALMERTRGICAELSEEQLKALRSGAYKWIQPGGYADMTETRIKDLTKLLERLRKAESRASELGIIRFDSGINLSAVALETRVILAF